MASQLALIRQIIDLREQVQKLAEEYGYVLTITVFPSVSRWVTLYPEDSDIGQLVISKSGDSPEHIRMSFEEGEGFNCENFTEIDLSLLGGDPDDA